MEQVINKRPIQLLIADDEAIIRRGVASLLKGYGQIKVIGEAESSTKAMELVEKSKPDIVVSDLLMPMMDGIEAIRQITAFQPGQRVIVLTDCAGEGTFFNQVVAWKALHRMMEAPDTKHNPNILSQREKDVLRLLTMGRTDNEIGEELFITTVTARTHINRIITNLGLRNRVAAALYGLRQGLVLL